MHLRVSSGKKDLEFIRQPADKDGKSVTDYCARRPVRKRWLEAAALAGDDSTPCQLLLPSLSAAWQSALPCPSCLRSFPHSLQTAEMMRYCRKSPGWELAAFSLTVNL
ncbi:hypothetical protein Baya_13422 [Bagarius yarrelli]|uniref:Uncharacterized protein n=1 Tax=Bagarius yarrelli TaxID=175774 RepID=A0A556V5J5_BAGYA|nr:hypothetical protein Baya_13422 [Bagarius yarrelli]